MAKSANLYARIEPSIKEQAEDILSVLGISASGAINLFYKQIILQQGLPFEVKIPSHPLDISKMKEAEFESLIQQGLNSIEAGKSEPAESVFAELRKEFE